MTNECVGSASNALIEHVVLGGGTADRPTSEVYFSLLCEQVTGTLSSRLKRDRRCFQERERPLNKQTLSAPFVLLRIVGRVSGLFSVCISYIALAHFPREISAPSTRQQPDKTSSVGFHRRTSVNQPMSYFRTTTSVQGHQTAKLQQCWSLLLKTITTCRKGCQYKLRANAASNNGHKSRSCWCSKITYTCQ